MHRLTYKQKRILAKNIRIYCDQIFPGKKSGSRLATQIGVSPQSVAQWMKGAHIPSLNHLYSLSLVFGTSMHELCGIDWPDDFDVNTATYETILLLTQQQKSTAQQRRPDKTGTRIMRMVTNALKTEFVE